MPPLLILLTGMAIVLVAILVFRLNAFLALITAAIVVALLGPGEAAVRIARVAEGFGRTAGAVGAVIALAAIIGSAMSKSGAADRIVTAFVNVLSEERSAVALAGTAWVLSLPVFFDTIFFLLAPLARSMYRRTNRQYLKYLLVMSASGVATHTLVPPHPGPLAMADTLGIDLGVMILMGMVISIPAAVVGFALAGWMDKRMPVPMREGVGETRALQTENLPGLLMALAPVVLPVLLISSNTIVDVLKSAFPSYASTWAAIRPYTATIGNPNVALLIAAALALWVYAARCRPTRQEMASLVESALMGSGVIILIIAAGGAFGATLQAAQIGPAVQNLFAGESLQTGMAFLFVAFGVSVVLKVAQGSSTVAMITAAGMMKAMIGGFALPFHTVYVATAIAGGSLVGSWMNDAGFWVFSKVGGVTEVETLKSWSPLVAVVGTVSMITTVLLAWLLPLR